MPQRPKLLYLVSEDWYFVSHRLALAVAAKAAGYDVVVATRHPYGGDPRRRLRLLAGSRVGLNPGEFQRCPRSLYRREAPDLVTTSR
jgi:hypothetical protein